MKIHLIRHSITEANENSRFQGLSDTPLTHSGERLAADTANALAEYEYEVIYSSPLKRSLDTSKLIAQELTADIRIAPELREICYGDWEGRAKDELRGTDTWERRDKDKYNFTHPGEYHGSEGQSYADIFERVSGFFEKIRASNYEFVLAVTHLGVLRNAKKYFEECSDEQAVAFTPASNQVYGVTLRNSNVETTLLDVN